MAKKKHKGLIIFLSIVGVLGATYGTIALANVGVSNNLIKYAKSFDKVSYDDQIKPTYNQEKNEYSFKTNREFKVMQLTDTHLGAGINSKKKDKLALNAIAAMITYEKPDLVVFTGDMSFPFPVISGTFNNKKPVLALATLMEKLGVYWTVTFGNHDSEAYSYYSRPQVAKFYENTEYKHCIYTDNYSKDIKGNGNQMINIYNEESLITKTIYCIDSNAYAPDDPLGAKWHYENVNENQISWYESKVLENNAYNKTTYDNLDSIKKDKYASFANGIAESFVFQHIPLEEYEIAYQEYMDNGYKDTDDVKFNFGLMQEDINGRWCCRPANSDNFFETMQELKSTKAMFVGHDHLNNYSVNYKGIDLTYGMSIDYLAYSHINKYGAQRGCTLAVIEQDGKYKLSQENYYNDKYVSKYPKDSPSMEPYKK